MNKNYCQVGTPVQFFYADEGFGGTYTLFPAVIYSVWGSRVNILVLAEGESYLARNVRHYDFRKSGKDFWQYIPQSHPSPPKNGKQKAVTANDN